MSSRFLRLSPRTRLAVLSCVFLALVSAHAAPPSLAPLPKPVASFDVGTIHVDKFGAGNQTLILIPGLACGPWVWASAVTTFSPNTTIYALTLPGFDGRPSSDKKPLLAAFANDFWTLLTEQKISQPVVVGHSLGGTLAIALAEEHPERLAGIVAVDGLPIFPLLANATPAARTAAAAQMAGMYAALDASQLLASQKQFMSTTGTIHPELVGPTATLEAKSDARAIAAWTAEDITTDLRPNLNKITVPFLEIMPYNPDDAKPPLGYSQDQTLAFYRSLVAGAPKVTVLALAPSRHFAMLDQPAAFEKTLADFLTSVK